MRLPLPIPSDSRNSSASPLVRFDLVTANGEALVVKISHHRHRDLKVSDGEKVFVTPGEMKFFPRQSDAEEKAGDSVDEIAASERETIIAAS